MKLGFTGTRKGMTHVQKTMLASWMSLWQTTQEIDECHHGTCVGADDEFHRLCKWFGLRIILHPPTDHKLTVTQHYLDVPDQDIRPAKKHLDRNIEIVRECTFLLACPPTMTPQQRGGTWHTIRQAEKMGVEHRIIYPE